MYDLMRCFYDCVVSQLKDAQADMDSNRLNKIDPLLKQAKPTAITQNYVIFFVAVKIAFSLPVWLLRSRLAQ